MLDEVLESDLYVYPVASSFLSFRWHVVHEQGKPLTRAARAFMEAVTAELARKKKGWAEILARRGERGP